MTTANLSSSPLRTLVRWCWWGSYFVCLMLAVALMSLLLATVLWEVFSGRLSNVLVGIDDDWALLALPVGGALGVWVAARMRRSRRFRRVCVPVGGGLLGIGLLQANRLFVASREASKEMGLAGIGPAIVGFLFLIVALVGGLLLGAALFGWLANGRRTASSATDLSPTPALPSTRT